MKVLLVTPDFPPSPGGIQNMMFNIATRMPGCEVLVVTLEGPGAVQAPGTRVVSVRTTPRAGRYAAVVALNAGAVYHAMRFRPDVVVSGHVVVAVGVAALARMIARPWVQVVYASEMALRPGLARWAFARATRVIAISTWTRAACVALGAAPRSVAMINPGVDDLTGLEPRPIPGRVLCLARLDDGYKGHDVLLRAMPLVRARVPHAHLDIGGGGRDRGRLTALTAALGVGDAVTLHGRVDDAGRRRLLSEAEVFAMPSRLHPSGQGEGFGIVYLEAALLGVPSVAGRAGGATDAVADGETGILVDPTDHVAVADALVRLLTDAPLRARMGAAAALRARARLWPAVAAEFAAELRRVAGPG